MSQEEHILHELKEMHNWVGHVDKQIARIKWSLWGMVSILILIIVILLFK